MTKERSRTAPGPLPALPSEHEPTRATLHAYARAVGAITRAHGVAHPRWWHVSLKVRPGSLVTDPMPLPGGGSAALAIDLRSHTIVLESGESTDPIIDMRSGATATEAGERLIDAVGRLGLGGPFDHERYADSGARAYDPGSARAYHGAFVAVAAIFERRRVELGDPVGPVQLWPHHFDLAFEWFGPRLQSGGDDVNRFQINLGFFPGDEPYFYSSPWPFDDSLVEVPLPAGAAWTVAGWRGARLPYDAVQGRPDAAARIDRFARSVFDAAAPGSGDS